MIGRQGTLAERGVALEPCATVTRRLHQQRPARAHLIRHDIANAPTPARPDAREVPRCDLGIVAAPRPEQFKRNVDGGGQPRTRGFRENACPAMIQRVLTRRRPLIVRCVGGDAGLAVGRHAPRHRHAEGVGARREHGIDVRLQRVHVRRNENASRVRTLLVHVVHDLWRPRRVQGIHRVARFLLREGVPVTVVVVPRVEVVQRGRIRALGRRIQRAAVPVAHDVHTVGVLARHQHDDRVRQNRFGFRRVGARQSIGHHQWREESAHFGGVNARRDQDDILSLRDERGPHGRRALPRIHQLLLNFLIARQIPERGRVTDERHDKRTSQRSLAERAHRDARARLVHGGEVVRHLFP